jgi:hypothetical protein
MCVWQFYHEESVCVSHILACYHALTFMPSRLNKLQEKTEAILIAHLVKLSINLFSTATIAG